MFDFTKLTTLARHAHSFLTTQVGTDVRHRVNNVFANFARNLFEAKYIPPVNLSNHIIEEQVKGTFGQFALGDGAASIDQVCYASQFLHDQIVEVNPDASFRPDAQISRYQKRSRGVKFDHDDAGESDLHAVTCLNQLYLLGGQFHTERYSQKSLAANEFKDGGLIYARQKSYLNDEKPPVAIAGLQGQDRLMSKLLVRGELSPVRAFVTRERSQDKYKDVANALTVMYQQKEESGADTRTPDELYRDIQVSSKMSFNADMFMRVKTMALSVHEATMKAANSLIEHYKFFQEYSSMEFMFLDDHIHQQKDGSEIPKIIMDIVSNPVYFAPMQTKMLAAPDFSYQAWVAYVPEHLISEKWVLGNFAEFSIPLIYVHKLITLMTSETFEESYHLANSSDDYMLRERIDTVTTLTHEDANGEPVAVSYYTYPSSGMFHKVQHRFSNQGPPVDCVMIGTAWLMAPLLGSNADAVDHLIVARRLPHIVYGAKLDEMLKAVSELPAVAMSIGSKDSVETYFEKEWNL